jgi:hypothetical protein
MSKNFEGIEELSVVRASDVAIQRRRRAWNGWELSDSTVLSYPAHHPDSSRYGFDLADLVSSAKMLDMIMQIDGKRWATDQCLAGLIHALNDILYPQAYLCSGGWDKRLKPKKIKALCEKSLPHQIQVSQ